ncbi:MAG: hypothetical protein RIB65_16485 [Ilumatobacter fluminis]|uniref:hypothetical protein n=1 Tax=Ilumatobacter fluminis TaxID=467091 RepID=UPI0032F064FD
MIRAVGALVIGLLAVVAAPSAVHADAAGPTDYLTEIVDVSPASDAIELAVIGGDAFIELSVAPGHEVVVLGYLPDQEPYLRFGADGAVERNIRSYATYYNENRYGTDDIPDVVDTTAEPEWEQVTDGGTYAWHDHRAHWMSDEPLVGLDPGESLPLDEIVLVVDGVETIVTVEITLQESASPVPALVGALLGAVIGLAGLTLGRASSTLVAMVLAIAALTAGVAQYTSLPASTGPETGWWLYPVVALGCSIAVIAIYRRSIWIESGLLALAGVQLLIWAWPRRDHATAAYLPTDLPADVDRVISMMVLVGSVFVIVAAGRSIVDAASPGDDPERVPG